MARNELTKDDRKELFVKRFKALLDTKREEKTDKEISEEIGITQQSLINYCDRIPDLEQLIKIKNYFDVSLEYLVGESNNKQYIDYSLGDKFGLSDETIHNLKEYVENGNEDLTYTINLLLGDECLSLIKTISDYVTFPSKDNKYLDDFINNSNKEELKKIFYKKYDEDNNIYIYRIMKQLEILTTKGKKSEQVAKMYIEKSSDIIAELENWDGD